MIRNYYIAREDVARILEGKESKCQEILEKHWKGEKMDLATVDYFRGQKDAFHIARILLTVAYSPQMRPLEARSDLERA